MELPTLFIKKQIDKLILGTHIVAAPGDCLNSQKDIFDQDFVMTITNNNFLVKLMETSQCHKNCENLFKNNDEIIQWHIGFALSNDRRWRSHSWCVNINNTIIETTVTRLAYLSHTIYKK